MITMSLKTTHLKVLLIDNFDSFTYNLYHLAAKQLYIFGGDSEVVVKRNSEITIDQIIHGGFNRIIISPGPGSCTDTGYFGVCSRVISEVGKFIPVLGICLGMQGIAVAFGGSVGYAQNKMHGKTSLISHVGTGIFCNLPQSLEVMRYHSQVVGCEMLPDCLEITATSLDDSEIMGLRHKVFPVQGVQFHPESYMTEGGKQMMMNFFTQET